MEGEYVHFALAIKWLLASNVEDSLTQHYLGNIATAETSDSVYLHAL